MGKRKRPTLSPAEWKAFTRFYDQGWIAKYDVDLSGYSLRGVVFRNMDLEDFDFSNVDLTGARFIECEFAETDFYEANLTDVKFTKCRNLRRANFEDANVRRANFDVASRSGMDVKEFLDNVRNGDTCNVKNPTQTVPKNLRGKIIGYKKVMVTQYQTAYWGDDAAIVTLEIPAKAKRVQPHYAKKIRASEAKVIAIETLDSKTAVKKGWSYHDEDFSYEVGKVVKSDKFDPDPSEDCSNGLHFFLNRQDAADYR